MTRIWIIPGRQSDDQIDKDTQRTLEVIRLSVTQEIADDENSQHQADDHEDLEVEVHGLVKAPANDHDKRGVEKGGLDRGADAVEEGKVLGDG